MSSPAVGKKVTDWLLLSLLGNVALTWFASAVLDSRDIGLLAIPPFVLATAVVLTAPGSYFSRSPDGKSSPLARTVAYLLLAAYVVVSVAGASLYQWSIPVVVVSSACLAGAATALLWATLKGTIPITYALGGVAFLLVGVAFLLVGVAFLRGGDTLGGVAFLLFGVAFLLVGVAFLRGGDTLGGVAFLLGGVAFLLVGVAFLRRGDTLGGVASLLFGVASLLVGVVALRGGDPLFGVAFLLFGVAALLFGVASLRGGDNLFGVASLLFGVASLLFGVAALLQPKPGWLVRWWDAFTTRR